MLWMVALTVLLQTTGCATSYVKLRKEPKLPLVDQLKLYTSKAASDRTMQVLRQYDLVGDLGGDPRELLNELQVYLEHEPSADKLYAFAELSFRAGKHCETTDANKALDFYGASVAYSYLYLFDERFAPLRNPYDPQFRGACDLYNGALECALRIVRKRGDLQPGKIYTIKTATQEFDCQVVLQGRGWQNEEFDHFEFASDYDVANISNEHRDFGLGVPLIAIRKPPAQQGPAERYYPQNLSFPMTAFLRLLPDDNTNCLRPGARHKAVIELYDPITTSDIPMGDRHVPLETDLTTPLAYFVNNPYLAHLDTVGLLRPDAVEAISGLYMLQPYDPGKIPVVMVHGLWSSPVTWMEMFNDLRSDPAIRDHYQVWFYLYPTGEPFWDSAVEFRNDLAEMRTALDPQRQNPALDQMVLVGHSMGGLVSKLQTIYSQDDFWHIVSDKPFASIQATPEDRQKLGDLFYFGPSPSVRRVITIGTPHHGSPLANNLTRYLAEKLIRLSDMMTANQLVSANKGLFHNTEVLEMDTSLDSLAPSSPFLPVMLKAPHAPWVKYHNIVGVIPQDEFLAKLTGEGDGVVSYDSAHLPDVESEVVVQAEHSQVHRHPLTVLEVRRILMEHLQQLRAETAIQPVSVPR